MLLVTEGDEIVSQWFFNHFCNQFYLILIQFIKTEHQLEVEDVATKYNTVLNYENPMQSQV